ncbi:MAG: hypothetical protein RLZZ502_6 [Pseudomonadota bacterium]|jgi:copper(I)-binding protein
MKFFILLGACFSTALLAHSTRLGDLRIGHSYAPATPPGAKVGAVFFPLSNNGKTADRLVKAESAIAGIVEIHTHVMDKGVMRMRALPHLDLAPETTVELKPGGFHIMLFELKKPLLKNESFSLILTFEKAGKVEVSVAVEDGVGRHGHTEHKH